MTFIAGFILCFIVIFCASVPPIYRAIDGNQTSERFMGTLMLIGLAMTVVGLIVEAVEFFL
jgi:hypothetical protein